jgi:hypothetical protein
MGGGKDQEQANKQLGKQSAYQEGQQKEFDIRNKADLEESRSKGNDLYKSLYGGYGSLAGDPNAPGGWGSTSGGGGGGGGGFVPPSANDPRFKDVESSYRNFMDTGGWEPDVRKAQQGRIDSLTEIGKTGGLTEEEKQRARGGGYYEEFAKTGGYSDRDLANIRSRANSGVPAAFSRMKAEGDRFANIQGGAGPGRSIMMGRLGRQQAAGAADASLNAEIGIKDKVNQGRQWGTQGMSTSELSLQDLLSKNKLSGLMGGNQSQQQMMESIMGGRQWGTGGLQGMAENDRQAAMQAAASSAAGDRWSQEFGLRQKLAGLGGLESLYGSSPDEYMRNKQFALDSSGVYGSGVGQAAMGQKTGNKSGWDTAAQIGGAVAGGLGGVMTGGMSSLAGGLMSGMAGGGAGGMQGTGQMASPYGQFGQPNQKFMGWAQ